MQELVKLYKFISDVDVYDKCQKEWLWVYDKLIVAKRQNLIAGASGMPTPKAANYIVRPITNLHMMGNSAKKLWLEKGDIKSTPPGFFWCEVLEGRQISVDYHWGIQSLTVEGFRRDESRLDRFSKWQKVDLDLPLPAMLHDLKYYQEWINVEYIGNKVIEIHLRQNDDFLNHSSDLIIPIWKEDAMSEKEGFSFYESKAADRIGFWVKKGSEE